MNFKNFLNEAVEPGQSSVEYVKRNYYVVHVPTVKKSKELQNWAFKNGFKWSGYKSREYNDSPNLNYGKEACIGLLFDGYYLEYCGKSYFESKKMEYGPVYTLEDFFEMMEEENRIKIKPSSIKKEK